MDGAVSSALTEIPKPGAGTGRAASLQSPHSPKDVQRLSHPQHPLGSRTTLCLRGPEDGLER